VLCPTLKPGDWVICDNLPAHKVAGGGELIEATGARLIDLPPYSPDLNPIENLFSKLTALLRKAAERSVAALWDRIAKLLSAFTAAQCNQPFQARWICVTKMAKRSSSTSALRGGRNLRSNFGSGTSDDFPPPANFQNVLPHQGEAI
jgi:hypothetical protein